MSSYKAFIYNYHFTPTFTPFLYILLFISLSSNAQPIYLSENFNQGWPTGWTTIDQDGNTPDSTVARFTDAWIIFPDIDSAKIGDSVASSTSWYSPPGQADDYMITPLIMIGSTTGVFWDAKAIDPDFSDGYELRISTTTPDIVGFMAHPPLFTTSSAPAKWTNFMVNLSAAGYQNQSVYLSWRNHSNDQFILSIDNIIVKELAPFDARISGIDSLSSYSHIPIHQNPSIHLAGQITNVGFQTITDAKLVAEVFKNGVSVHEDSSQGINLNFGEWANLAM
ncbi:MAG: choice-of-anchor J domain-containing protein, partial [Bacteroidetes bacterium]|nr:choice-of-anchor J domain-containing protein [Bacteroidota bacterium]